MVLARIFVAIGGLIVLALSVALVGPYFVDWSSYRAEFEREMSRVLGRDVRVEGAASARLLPFPSVTFNDVIVQGLTPGEPAMTIETFSMDAELAPFMRGEVLIFDMRLERPTAIIDVADDGTLDWAIRPSVPFDARNITLEKVSVQQGRVELRHATSGRSHTISELDADVSARSLAGPWRLDGTMRLDGMRTTLAISTGTVDEAGAMRLRMRLQPERYPIALETDGTARIDNGEGRYEGQFRLNAGMRPPETGAAASSQRPALAAYRLSGLFGFDHQMLSVDEFRLETGPAEAPYTADGSAQFDLGAEPRFLVRADGAQVRFEDEPGEGGPAQPVTGLDFAQRLAGFRDFVLDLPRPAIPGRVEVRLPAIVAGDTTVRDVHLMAEPSEAGWRIDSIGALLPGRTTLEATGELSAGDSLGFEGSLLLAVAQPSGFAAWMARDIDDAIRRLPAAGFSADVSLTDERQAFRNLELVLGAARFEGEIDHRSPADARPSMALTLSGQALDVDGMAAFASLFINDAGANRLAGHDLSFEIEAGPVSVGGLTAQSLDTALRLSQGNLEIDRLTIGGLAGASVSATGSVRDIAGGPTGNVDATVIAADLAPLVETAAALYPDNVLLNGLMQRSRAHGGLLEDSHFDIMMSGADNGDGTRGVAISATGRAGGSDLTLTASTSELVDNPIRAPGRLQMTASNDDAIMLYALLGLPTLPLDVVGAAEAGLELEGVLAEGARTRFAFTGEGLDAGLAGTFHWSEGRGGLRGDAHLRADDLEPWLVAAGQAVPGAAFGLPVRLEGAIDYEDGLLVGSGVVGEVAGSALSGDLNAELRDGLAHVTGALSLDSLDLVPLVEMVAGSEALQGDGQSWPATPFASSIAVPLTGEIDLAVSRLFAGPAALARAQFTARLGRDGVALSNISASGFGGQLDGLVELRNDRGTGLLSAQMQLVNGNLPAFLPELGLRGGIDLSATVTASGKSVEALVQALAGSGSATITNLVVPGVSPGAFPAIIAEADTYGADIDAAATGVFAPALVGSGALRAERLELAFTVANGTVRVPPLRVEVPGAVLTGDLRADLPAGTVAADASLTFVPGDEQLVGSEPSVRFVVEGPLEDIGVLVDTEPLAQFLAQRALEREQARVEAMQAQLLERQRMRREERYFASLQQERERLADEARRAEEARQAAQEAERLRREEESRRQQEEEARARAEDAERRAAEEEEALRQASEAEQAEQAERRAAEQRRLDAQAARRAEQEAAEQARRDAQSEQQRLEDLRLREEVESLLRRRLESPTPRDPNAIERAPLPAPAMRNDDNATSGGEQSRSPVPSPTDAFSQRNLTVDGLLRAIGQ